MDITFKTAKLKRVLEDPAKRMRKYGAGMAGKIKLRLAVLRAADSLADFWPPNSSPERCHELTANLAGQLSMDLKQPYRLLFAPSAIDEKTKYPSEHDRWKAITAVEILGIEDTHG